ncbi:hypothetical protein [Streptomyces spinosisporus]|uniref:XRE family transcriptional regulator n=1 Tax=Streptomyces spinosisporus TaxID=2927582 RepID=A0ABS9XDR6_9ACTN|nr:hypothetical protein [Streptomyces spinosisporus]MCI3240233.1 hypothetical protein [Streptomyces spinosisporus]
MGSPEHGTPQPPPEADLIRLARQARGLSPEEAADRTPVRIKGFRWRQIEKGWKGKPGESDRVIGPDKTIAHMSHTVGVTSARLAEHRPKAAEILREIEIQSIERSDNLPDPLGNLTAERQRIILEMVAELAVEDRAPALRRLAERLEAGELGTADGPSRSTDLRGVDERPPRAM